MKKLKSKLALVVVGPPHWVELLSVVRGGGVRSPVQPSAAGSPVCVVSVT